VIIFVTLHYGTRYAFVGDLVWQLEGITQREERSWLIRKFADLDAEGNRENLLRMTALKERLPELIIVPAHDMRAFAQMPTLSEGSSETERPSERVLPRDETTQRPPVKNQRTTLPQHSDEQ